MKQPTNPDTPRFDLGPVVATPGALEALGRNSMTGLEILVRHSRGDWGDLCDDDKKANDAAIKDVVVELVKVSVVGVVKGLGLVAGDDDHPVGRE